ncbi:MAG: Fic family protein [Bryobacteraceae bacterium]|jgi:fido (protein-threonine AMPylation protein)
MRRTDIQRNSRPASHELFGSLEEKALLEARNGLLQFDEVLRLVDQSASGLRLRPSIVQRLQRLAIRDIYTCAGNYRTGPVNIQGTTHEPPPASEVAEHVEEMCEYINVNRERSPLHLAAYAMWRLNWIHPFAGGNGRTSRAVSYFVLCARLGYRIPGTRTIPEQIVANRQPYYEALDSADAAWSEGRLDISLMEKLIEDMLAVQLSSVLEAASSEGTPPIRKPPEADTPAAPGCGTSSPRPT